VFGTRLDVPETTVRHLLARAPRSGGLRRLRVLRVAVGLAAAVLLSVFLWSLGADLDAPAASPVAREDFDGNGRVDILDAYRLTLWLEDGAVADARWDLNTDGRVDGIDVAMVTRRAVSIDGGGE
jgi:hypothetical protein